jgi:hypothetical protein
VEETDRMMSDGTSAAADSTFAPLPATIPAILRREGQSHGEVSTHMTLWYPSICSWVIGLALRALNIHIDINRRGRERGRSDLFSCERAQDRKQTSAVATSFGVEKAAA